MAIYRFRCVNPDCPSCGHITTLTMSMAAMRDLPPIRCSCGTEKKRVIEPIALSSGRATEGAPHGR